MPQSLADLEAARTGVLQQFLTLGDLRPGTVSAIPRRCGKPTSHCAQPGVASYANHVAVEYDKAGVFNDTQVQTKGDDTRAFAEIEPGTAKEFGFNVRGRKVNCTVKENARDITLANGQLSSQLGLQNGKLGLRILVDRASVEVFGNSGELAIPTCFLPDENNP